LPQWCEWWYVWAWNTRRGLKPNLCRLPRPWLLWEYPPARENSHGRTGNRNRDLMASSQKFWPPSHEAGGGIFLAAWKYNSLSTLLPAVPVWGLRHNHVTSEVT
jgi:hypothetical protein